MSNANPERYYHSSAAGVFPGPKISGQQLTQHQLAEQQPRSRSNTRGVGWELRLSYLQVLTLWVVTGALMVLVFFFGLWAGQKQGFELALNQSAGTELKLPLRPSVSLSSGNSFGSEEKVDLAEELTASRLSVPTGNTAAGEGAQQADFAVSAKLGVARTESTTTSSPVLGSTAVSPGVTTQTPVKSTPETTGTSGNQKSNLKPGWYVQLASASSSVEAASQQAKAKAKGLRTSVEFATVGTKSYQRVVVGPFPTKVAALDKSRSLKSQKVFTGEPLVRFIDSE